MAGRRSRRPSPEEEEEEEGLQPWRPRLDPQTRANTPRMPTRGLNMPNTTNAPGEIALTGHQSTVESTAILDAMIARDKKSELRSEKYYKDKKEREKQGQGKQGREKQQRGNESQRPSRDTRTNVSRSRGERRENQPQSGGRHPSQHPSTDPRPGLPSTGDPYRYADYRMPAPLGTGYTGNPEAPHNQPPVIPQVPQFVSPYQQGSGYPQQNVYSPETAYQRSAYQPESAYQQPIPRSAELQRPAQESADRQHQLEMASVTQGMSQSSLVTSRPTDPPMGPQPANPSEEVHILTEEDKKEMIRARNRAYKAKSREKLKNPPQEVHIPTEEEKRQKKNAQKRASAARSLERLNQLPPDEREAIVKTQRDNKAARSQERLNQLPPDEREAIVKTRRDNRAARSRERLNQLPPDQREAIVKERRDIKAARSLEILNQLPPDQREATVNERRDNRRASTKKWQTAHRPERTKYERERRAKKRKELQGSGPAPSDQSSDQESAHSSDEDVREDVRSMPPPPAPGRLTGPRPSRGDRTQTAAHHTGSEYQQPIPGNAEVQRSAQRSANRQHEYDVASVTHGMSSSSLTTSRSSGPPPGPQPPMPSWEVNLPTETETVAPKKRRRGAKALPEPYPGEQEFRVAPEPAEPLKPLPTEEEKKAKREREKEVKRLSAARSREKLRQEIEQLPPEERDEREAQRLQKGREESKKYRDRHGDEINARRRDRRFEKNQQAWETEDRAGEEARSMLPAAPDRLTAPRPSGGNRTQTTTHHTSEPQIQPLPTPRNQRSGQATTSGRSAPSQGHLGHRRLREDDSPSSSHPSTPRPSGSSKSHGKKHRKTK